MFVKSKLAVFLLCISVPIISVFTGCNVQYIPSQSSTYTESTTTVQETTVAQTTQDTPDYQSESTTPNTEQFKNVYDEYVEALISKTPVVINEFNSESEFLGDGINSDNLLEQKKGELTDIFNEGLAQFVIVVGETGADNDEYEFWHTKLEEVYNTQVSEFLSNCSAQAGAEYGEDVDY